MKQELWIFGYGSLVWRPAFAFRERLAATVEGWVRRFWQGSTDHRGVPGRPGRVVTLVPEAGGRCHGVAYRVAPQDRAPVLAALDHRERGGYVRERVELQLPGAAPGRVEGLLYRARETNPNYLGPAPLDEIARQVRIACGPSGPNPEYVFRLAEALRALDADDPHVWELEALLRRD